MSTESTADTPRVCQRFSAEDADVTICSSDGILFKIHSVNLERSSEGILHSTGASGTAGTVVDLPESADVLELLFQYMYRQRQPDLSGRHVRFSTLYCLAEAAEKYQVFSAMDMCRLVLVTRAADSPMDVFVYGARHGYDDLCDAAASQTIATPADTALSLLGYDVFIPWVMYREQWIAAYHNALHPPPALQHKGGSANCDEWPPARDAVLAALAVGLTALLDVPALFAAGASLRCSHCRKRVDKWRWCIGVSVVVKEFSAVRASVREEGAAAGDAV